jgi:hypothetical protein
MSSNDYTRMYRPPASSSLFWNSFWLLLCFAGHPNAFVLFAKGRDSIHYPYSRFRVARQVSGHDLSD